MDFKKLLIAGTILAAGIFATSCWNSKKTCENDRKTTLKNEKIAGNSGKIKIVSTIFPEYDWVREIAGEKIDNFELTFLLSGGIDLHSYRPSIQDLAKISTADLFIYVGGESDGWVEAALKASRNKKLKVINLMEILGERLKEEELKEGMQGEEENSHDEKNGHHHEDKAFHEHKKEHAHHHKENAHHHEEEHHHHEETAHHHEEGEYDEHVWLSLRNAQIICEEIASTLSKMDSSNAALYQKNLSSYKSRLSALDKAYTETIESFTKKTLIFADRFPFRYLTEDYGLNYYAAFIRCSAESEASFETVAFLAGKVDELNLNCVFKIEESDGKIAETVVRNSKNKNAQILTLNSIQSVTLKEATGGTTYLKIMEENLEVLKKAL